MSQLKESSRDAAADRSRGATGHPGCAYIHATHVHPHRPRWARRAHRRAEDRWIRHYRTPRATPAAARRSHTASPPRAITVVHRCSSALGSVRSWTSAACLTPSMPCPPVYRCSRRAGREGSVARSSRHPSCPPRRLNALTMPPPPPPSAVPQADAHRHATGRKALPTVSFPEFDANRLHPYRPDPAHVRSTCNALAAGGPTPPCRGGRPTAPERPCGTTISSRARGRRRHRQRSRTGGTRARRRRTR